MIAVLHCRKTDQTGGADAKKESPARSSAGEGEQERLAEATDVLGMKRYPCVRKLSVSTKLKALGSSSGFLPSGN